MRERQPYQEDENRNKPGPFRKLTFLDEFLLVLMQLKAGLFVQDLADRFGVSTSLVSRICIRSEALEPRLAHSCRSLSRFL